MGDAATDSRVGSTLQGRYRIESSLSSGAMGAVYRAERIGLGRKVAIKFLHRHFAEQPDFIKRFEHEALAMSKLNHPHCVSVIDFGVEESPFIVMDYVTGRTLLEVIDEGPVPAPRAGGIIGQLLGGLAHAHDHGIIHRDIKPANVMLSRATGAGDHVHILDFGLAKLRDSDMSMSGIVVGTPSYMSPEQAGYKKLDGRSDLYSTGVLLFELLTGKKPFRADETFDIIRLHLEAPPPALRDLYPEGRFSAELEAVVQRALAKEASERFPTALDFSEALSEATGDDRRSDRSPSLPSQHRPPSPRDGAHAPAASPGIGSTEIAPMEADGAAVGERPAVAAATAETEPPRPWRVRRRYALAGLTAVALGAWLVAGAPIGWVDAARGVFDSARAAVGGSGGDGKAARDTPVNSVDDARALAARGERDEAIRGLHDLRRHSPEDGEILLVMGQLYFDRGWHDEALAAFAEAVALEPSYREREDIADRAVEALGEEGSRRSARVLLIRDMGAPALPSLRRAAETAESEAVAAELGEIVAQIERRSGED